MRVLVVDTDAALRQKIVMLLTQYGFSVDTAATGPEALDLARRQPYEVVVTELRLEGMDGLEMLTRFKARYPGVGSVLMSAPPKEEVYLRALRCGAGDLLKKPFQGEALLKAVQEQSRKAQVVTDSPSAEAMRKMLLSALETIARSIDLAQVPGRPLQGMQPLGALALQLARELQWEEQQCEETMLATWIQAFSELPVESPFLIDYDQFPPSLLKILSHLAQPLTPGAPAESRLVAVVLALGRGDDFNHPELYDPELVEKIRLRPKSPYLQEGQHRRLILSRVSAMDSLSQRAEATSLLEQVVKSDLTSREAIRALLELTRISGKADSAVQAVNTSQRIGPILNAETCLEAGILLGQQHLSGAESFLQRASRFYRDGQVRHRQALCSLAQAAFGFSSLTGEALRNALEQLQSGPERELSSLHLDWLGPWLASLSDLEKIPEGLKLVAAWAHRDPSHEVPKALRSALKVLQGEDLGPRFSLRLMGPMELRHNNRRVPVQNWKSQKARWLFAYLAAHPQNTFQETELKAIAGESSLPWLLDCISSCLGTTSAVLVTENGLSLNPHLPIWTDLEQADLAFALAQMLQGAEAAAQYQRLVSLSRGTVLEDCPQPWVEDLRLRHHNRYLNSLQWLAQWWLQERRPAESLEYASQWMDVEPAQEMASVVAMDSLLALNRVEEALRLFERCKSNGEPGEALKAAHQRAILTLTS